jgi:hypothetical protein
MMIAAKVFDVPPSVMLYRLKSLRDDRAIMKDAINWEK